MQFIQRLAIYLSVLITWQKAILSFRKRNISFHSYEKNVYVLFPLNINKRICIKTKIIKFPQGASHGRGIIPLHPQIPLLLAPQPQCQGWI